jgi:hypothetical protein
MKAIEKLAYQSIKIILSFI